MKNIMIVDDDSDIRVLVRMIFSTDLEFTIVGDSESAEEALEKLMSNEVGLIVLDHGLTGELNGIETAPLFKEIAPQMKIILFTADPTLQGRAAREPAIDAFLVKTNLRQLLPTARRLCGLGTP